MAESGRPSASRISAHRNRTLTCRICRKQLVPTLHDVSGAQGNVQVTCRGLPSLRCPDSHETRAAYPNFELELLEAITDAVPKSKSHVSARRVVYECTGCRAPLNVSGLASTSFRFQLRLGNNTVDATVAMPVARCSQCGKEQALGQRTQLSGAVGDCLSDAIIDMLAQAKIVQRGRVPDFQASPYASRAAIVFLSLMLVVAFLVVLSLAPVEVKSSPVFWIAIAAWALAAFPLVPPDEIPGVRPPGRAGILGWELVASAFVFFFIALGVSDFFPIGEIGFGVSGCLLSLAAWFVYSYLWTGAISSCPVCGTWRVFLRYEGAWYCNNCGLPLSLGPGSRPRFGAQGLDKVQARQRRRFLVGFILGPLWLFVGLGTVGVAAVLGYPASIVGPAEFRLLWGFVATVGVSIAAYRQHVRASQVPRG